MTGAPDLNGPTANDIHLWRVSLAAGDDLAMRAATLSADERQRAARFRFPADRDRFVAARGALRLILGHALNRPPVAIRFTYGPHGKPMLDRQSGDPDLRFNLSHAADLALIAVTRGREVGVDLEKLRPVPEAMRIAATYFAPAERALLADAAATDRDATFLRLWTAREALAKGQGVGLTGRKPNQALPVPALPTATDQGWQVCPLDPGPGYVASLAIEGSGYRLTLRDWGSPDQGKQ